MQRIVGGYIELYTYSDDIGFVLNEEGKLCDPAIFNRALLRDFDDEDSEILDLIVGTFFVCGLGEENFISLTDEQAEKWLKVFEKPQTFTVDEDYGLLIIE